MFLTSPGGAADPPYKARLTLISNPGIVVHCGERLAGNAYAVRISTAPRSAFKGPAALIPLEFLPLLVLFETGIAILPPGPGAAASSRENNWSVLLRCFLFQNERFDIVFDPATFPPKFSEP